MYIRRDLCECNEIRKVSEISTVRYLSITENSLFLADDNFEFSITISFHAMISPSSILLLHNVLTNVPVMSAKIRRARINRMQPDLFIIL